MIELAPQAYCSTVNIFLWKQIESTTVKKKTWTNRSHAVILYHKKISNQKKPLIPFDMTVTARSKITTAWMSSPLTWQSGENPTSGLWRATAAAPSSGRRPCGRRALRFADPPAASPAAAPGPESGRRRRRLPQQLQPQHVRKQGEDVDNYKHPTSGETDDIHSNWKF